MRGLSCAVLILTVALLAGCQAARTVAPRDQGQRETDLASQWAAERERLAVEFAASLTADQVATANGAEGLKWPALTQDQRTILSRLWEINHDLLVTVGKVPEKAPDVLNPGPLQEAKVFKVGYAFVPEETKEWTLYRFQSQRYPVSTPFDGTVRKARSLTPGLSAHGINFSETGEVRQWLKPPPEVTGEMEAAEERAKGRGGYATSHDN